ncbi:lytic murein transglycosylase [Sulfurovum sp. bin170]|uniref:lytic murein transglycosylase n=1 Tax=Sulfurovum sp. bin170 TaxID=2695268 RepID=UPI0013E085B3|nr:lytic murein transglycosylase [Sulfurovum sp. bin170]NEW60192.1 lytic murein transglycosylase [Sulfurovum sp. bin170]
MKKSIMVLLLVLGTTQIGVAKECKNRTSFSNWLGHFKQDALRNGISQKTVNSALNGLKYSPSVIKKDRKQNQFSQTFSGFSSKLVSQYRLNKGRKLIRKYGTLFRNIEKSYGIPASVITAYWGLETSFGAVQGKFSTIRSLGTLAYDCRRGEKFRPELLSALALIDRGDLKLSEMKGAWAGEIGQTQFLPSYYLKYAVDFDKDGRRNLIKSVPDALASTANYLKNAGWRRGEPWLEEVVLPKKMPWKQSGIEHSYSLSHWAKLGVKRANGRKLRGGLSASLLLPMGKDGAAFLAYHNFKIVYLKWNESLLYSTTAAYFATRLAGAKKVRPSRAKIASLSFAQVKQLQKLLVRRGYDVGDVDGIIGEKTRKAVKQVQQQFKLAADAYPTVGLLKRLQ